MLTSVISIRSKRAHFSSIAVLGILLCTIGLALGDSHQAAAFSPNYNPSNIIDNPTFTNSGTMSSSVIQTFLANVGSGLAHYSDVEACDSAIAPYYTHCGQTISAAQIIYDASQAYGVNPRAILAMLEKEQALVTDPAPSSSQINCAMGFNSCGGYVGFFTQVDNGAWILKYNYEAAFGNANWLSWHPASYYPCAQASRLYSTGLYAGNSVRFADPGGTPETITIANAATASLYCYTPYVGPYNVTGYSGSYNFVYFYQLWFGSTYTSEQYAWTEQGQGAYIDSGYTQEFNRGGAHAIVAPGGTAYLRVQALNNGYETWSQSIVHLGTSGPNDRCSGFANGSWLSCSRIEMQQNSVIPGAMATFNFSITAPQVPGTYIEHFNVLADGITWTAGPGLFFVINVVTPNSGASGTTIPGGTTITPGTVTQSPDGNSALVVQNDGNVVLYIEGRAAWWSGTYGYAISRFVMQTDGNLVLYGKDGVPDWSSGTYGYTGDHLALQTDGNLVIYSSSNQPLWSSGTNGVPDGYDYITQSLSSPAVLFPGQQLSTADRSRILKLQTDGNLVLYSSGNPTWSSGTYGQPSAELYMQPDGNLVIYGTSGQSLWASATNGRGGSSLVLQNDGNLVVYSSSGPTWSSGTYGK
ncbi:MAG TPA: hypothetical protein VGS08_02035 [Candidatus Saccharimonadales bacterium]|nr:hypothetical protein [Candidatus Saccharimonadales bacterium]